MVIGYHVHKTRIIRGTSEFFNIRITRFSTFQTLHFKNNIDYTMSVVSKTIFWTKYCLHLIQCILWNSFQTSDSIFWVIWLNGRVAFFLLNLQQY